MSDHDLDPDLSDVFRSLYGGEDWAFDDDEPSEALVPDVEVVERDLELTDQRYTREYFRSNLDSLLDHRTGSTSRIYPAVRTFNTIVSSTEPIPSGPSGCYAPYSHLSLLNRLQTYTTSTFSTHPPPLSPVTLALHGWRNDGRETLTCDACQGSWNLLALEEIRDGNVRAEVARRLGKGLQTRHLPSCPWRAKRTPDDVYATIRTSLHPLALQSLAALVNSLEPNVPPGLRYISPLVSVLERACRLTLVPDPGIHTRHTSC
ncbi:C3HC zinc finger-like-domain-containing protein [Kockovaella imperatae]|uniref:C3HC zinc finger-like-domain-containing protein n=1 Tax=Kockovaella imperatae TaxID=4999 RepID=A0A1Y1UC03_9TREE|nr:C3HC zinc finger-like-domain-containing protein [Kockovaella imperatae]ORX35578.1 C3HC zinc finger-like-domain-containing protein [Kockovaella imperatae]